MAERARLESECSRKVTVGSNPTLTAHTKYQSLVTIHNLGGLAEWTNAPVLKTGGVNPLHRFESCTHRPPFLNFAGFFGKFWGFVLESG